MLQPQLKNWNSVPRGGTYDLNIPEKGMVGTGHTFEVLMESVKAYRRANAIPTGLGFTAELEREVCSKYPENCQENDVRLPSSRKLHIDDVVAGTKVMARLKLSGTPLESQQEANRRAQICVGCPQNQPFAKPCTGICQSLKDVVEAIVGGAGTPYDQNLHSCQICACFLSSAVFVPLAMQQAVLTEEQKQQFRYVRETGVPCWKAEGL